MTDLEQQNTLCNSNVLNWWLETLPNSTKLVVIKTTGDGNCLCHSISQALQFNEDKDLRLRTALYNFVKKHEDELRNLWEDNGLRERKALGEASHTLTKEELDKEWKEIVTSASPFPTPGSTNYYFLEKIHIFSLANLLRTTIIVLTEKYVHGLSQPLQLNDIGGIYLPFLYEPFAPETVRPLFITYSNRHFSALIAEAPSTNYRIPIIDSAGNILKVHFVDDNFATDYMILSVLKQYMSISKNDNSPFHASCQNMIIQNSKQSKGLVVLEGNQTSKGWGLNTKHAIKTGTFIIEYMGEVVSKNEYNTRLESNYADNTHIYGMTLNSDLVIDATKKGNISRYINHSCSPNCEVQKWSIDGWLRMCIFAKTDILPNEELTFD